MTPPLAHSGGHWLSSLIYAAPVVLLIAAFGMMIWRDRRADQRREADQRS